MDLHFVVTAMLPVATARPAVAVTRGSGVTPGRGADSLPPMADAERAQSLIVVTRRPPGRALQQLSAVAQVWLWDEDRVIPGDVLRRQVADADGLYCMLTDPIDAALLDVAPRLRALSQMAVGVDNIDLAACTARGIPVGHTPEVLTETTADTAFALLMASVRRIVEGADYVRAGEWRRWEPDLLLGEDIHDTTLGIVGLGRIGRGVARRAGGFGMRLLYHNRTPDPQAEREVGAEYRSLPDLLGESDHVMLLTPLTEETHHLIDEAALRLMKPSATLVNAARGGIVDPAALYRALRDGVIARAALDVTEPEPIPPDDPLLTLPNCLIIPHLGSASHRTRAAMAELAADNLVAALQGRPMLRCANPDVYP